MLNGQEDARSIILQYQEANSIEDLTSEIQYRNISKKGRVQSRELQQYIHRADKASNKYNFLLQFTAPGDIAGTSTLTLQHQEKDDDQWLYLPALRSAKKISASKKSDRFMGTEMTYEDLSNYLSEPVDEYNYTLIGEDEMSGSKTMKIEVSPLQGTQSQYSKKVVWIDESVNQMLRMEFYNKKGELLKTFVASDIRLVPGTSHYRAHQIVIENQKTGNRTEVVYDGFVIDSGVEKEMFSKSYLESL